MTNPLNKVLNRLLENPRQIFLVDGVGALISAIFLGVILVSMEAKIGMPVRLLYVLAALALVYAAYSFLCYFVVKKNWRPYLKVIAVANLLHCCLTAVLVNLHFSQLTNLGLTYFLLEILVVVSVAGFELAMACKR